MKKKMCMTMTLAACFMLFTQMVMAKQVLRLGFGDPMDSDQGELAERFKNVAEGLSDGEIEVQLFPNGALGTETEMLQNARRGTLDIAIVGIGNMVPFVKDVGTLTMPYLLESHYDAIKATTGELGKMWSEITEKKGGFKILGWTYSGFRNLTNSKQPVMNMAEIKGLKIRIPQNKIILETFNAWGANAVPMAWTETFTALQQKVVDGQENPYIVNYTMKFHEVQDYLTEIHYQYSLQPVIVGMRSWKKYDDKTKNILIRAGIEAQQYNMAFQILEADKAKQKMIDSGMKFNTLNDEAEWKKIAVEQVWPQFYDFIGGKENLDKVMQALGK